MSIIKREGLPHFVVKKNLQKSGTRGIYFSDVVTEEVLRDVCLKITGQMEFTCEYVDNSYHDPFLDATYNKGRLAILHVEDTVCYISFSEREIGGRNYSVQSVPTAFNLFYLNPYPNKRLFYYFLNVAGNAETAYQRLIYRLMRTIGFTFLNASPSLEQISSPFTSAEDIILNRKVNADRNRSNNSTYLTKGTDGALEVYGKTYGANKYETSLICYALACLRRPEQRIRLYEVLEGDLKELPEASLRVIRKMGGIDVVRTGMTLEKRNYQENKSLRSPLYIYNLLRRLGDKHCALCGCEIPEIIQGAHVWPVSKIKKAPGLTPEQRLEYALDGENGLWLCENHHKLFDENLLSFDQDGSVRLREGLDERYANYIQEITKIQSLPQSMLTKRFLWYLEQRSLSVS